MTFYDTKISPPAERTVAIPPITRGISDYGWAQDASQSFASQLQNCTYQGQQLLLGRGDDTKLIGDTFFSTIGAFKKVVYDGSAGQYYGITETAFCKLDLSAGTVTSVETTTASPGYTDIEMFNGDVIIAKNNHLYRYDGTTVYSCGSFYNQITTPVDFGNLSDTDLTAAGATTLLAYTVSSAVRATNAQVVLKKTGTVSGEVYLTIDDGTTTQRSEKVNVDIGIGYEYAIVSFDFITPLTVAASGTVTVKIMVSEGDSSNYISVADISGTKQVNLNGPIQPRATAMTVFRGRMYCFMDSSAGSAPSENFPIYYCNYNNIDDWYSTSLDGMVSYGGYFYINDDIHSEPKGLSVFRHQLVVSGFSGGKARTELRDENNMIVNATTDAVDYHNCLLATPVLTFIIHPKSAENNFSLYAWSGVEEDVTLTQDLANMVASQVGDQWTNGAEIIAEIDDWADTLWVAHGQQKTIFIYHIKSRQWTTFSFSYALNGMSYVNGKMLLFGADGTVNEYKHGTVSSTAETIVKTKKFRMSHFTRSRLKEFIWYIEHSGFTGQVTIISELGGFETNHYISGSPPKPVRVRGIKDMSITFKLTDVGITEKTPVGEIVCLLANDGRSIS